MSTALVTFIVLSGVALLLFMVMKLKISAFIAILVTAMYVGIFAGLDLKKVLASIQNGMGGTLGFVAVIVGLGAIFGQILESSGGAESLAHNLTLRFGKEKASWAMMITGFIVAIPVFFDVGFIILVPLVYALSRDTGKSMLNYGIPLLAGLAVTHSFIPPTPGPVAVADILHASLGWVILFGFLLGVPTAIIAGPLFGRYIASRIYIKPPEYSEGEVKEKHTSLPSFRLIAGIIGMPLLLIVISAFTELMVKQHPERQSLFTDIIGFIGHPFTALILATLAAIYFLGIRRGASKKTLLDLSNKALGPAGLIILITGAGGALKQVLTDSNIGTTLATSMQHAQLSPILLAWVLAALVRVTQGSATVAMITAAGLVAPLIDSLGVGDLERALVVIAVASGATLLSHVNDSGFWLVGKYFGMSEKQTLQSWTVMESIVAVCGLVLCLAVSLFI